MYNIIIADDEEVEREGLKAILLQGMPGADLNIRLARNGNEAVELSRAAAPDLILMDIKMPGMDGLEAIQLICGECAATKFIMVTAYDMFEYAKQAIKLGVKDYLLKPSRISEIIDTVSRVLAEIECERKATEQYDADRHTLNRMKPVVEADVVMQLLFGQVHDVQLEEMVGWLGRSVASEAFVVLVKLNVAVPAGRSYSALKMKMEQLGCGWTGALTGHQIPLIIFREPDLSYRAQAATLARQLLTLPTAEGTSCFIGIGGPYRALEELRYSYREALLASADVTLPSRHRMYADLPDSQWQKVPGFQDGREKQLIEHVRLGKWEAVLHAVTERIADHEMANARVHSAAQHVQESLWVINRVLKEMGLDAEQPYLSPEIQNFQQLRAETASLLGQLAKLQEAKRQDTEPDLIRRIQQYIQEHAHEEISLESIAEHVQLSPYYVSKMFKDALGVNYIDYLTECRIEKVKSLLLNPGKSLKEISYEVGYHDPNYLSKVFKKVSGLSPTEYRQAALGNKVQAPS